MQCTRSQFCVLFSGDAAAAAPNKIFMFHLFPSLSFSGSPTDEQNAVRAA